MGFLDRNLSGLSDVTVAKDQLLKVLERNRAQHLETFDKAVGNFRTKAIEQLDALTAEIVRGKLPRTLTINLPIPEEHTTDYDRAIRMLKMHVGDTITLSEEAYTRLVDDDWGWRREFLSNTVAYLDK